MGCAASAQAATVPQAGVVKQTTPRQNHLHAGSIPQAPRDTASTQARVVEPTTPHDDMRPGTLRHEPSVVAAKAHAEELNRRMDKRDEINRQMQCDKETDQEILNKKLETLFDALRGPDPALMKSKHGILKEEQKKVLTDGLIALGISRRTDDFINDLLDESTEQLNTGEFTAKVKEELQISLRMKWLQEQTQILREIAKALPSPKSGTDDPLGGIRALNAQTPGDRKETEDVLHAVGRSVEKCLEESIQNLSRTQELPTKEQTSKNSNSKFSFDSSLFEAKYGGLDDFKKGVGEVIGAPHPKVWEEIMKEHMERYDSDKTFNPGNYDMKTCPRDEYLTVIDVRKGAEASKKSNGKRRVLSVDQLRLIKIAIKAKLQRPELISISLYTGPMFYKYNAVLRQFPKKALDSCKNDDWASGLEWTIVDDEQLAEHQVLDNPELAKALESKTKFTQEQWKHFKIKEEWKDFKINFTQKELEDFKIKDLSIGHVVQWGPFYFKPDTEGSVVLGTYNTYPTTINALLSGMQKLMWVAPVPKDRFVYRGLGGLNLPETFFAQDQLGVRGGTELGMMSTTRNFEVALQYTGYKKKKMPTVFKIGINAVSRGAVLQEFSQYPDEEEVLFPPRSFLEVVGEITYVTTEDGTVVRVVPLEVNANISSPLLEELVGMRKKLYIDSFAHQAQNLERDLVDLMEDTDSEFCREMAEKKVEKGIVIKKIVKQFNEVLDKHNAYDARWYNDDGHYRSAVTEMLTMKENAMAVPFLTSFMYEEWKNKMEKLRQANRMVSKHRSSALRRGDMDEQRKIGALGLCKAHGIIVEDLEEKNEMMETPLIREAADGDARHVEWLIVAGADVNATMKDQKIGFSALHGAAYFGNAHCVQVLLKFNADLRVLDAMGGTPLVAACLFGELECVQILLEKGAEATYPDGAVATNPDGAVTRKPVPYIDKATTSGTTPLMKAATGGWLRCVRVLIVAGADKEVTRHDKNDGKHKTALDMVNEKIKELKTELKTKSNKTSDTVRNYEKILEVLDMTPDKIREEDSKEIAQYDSSRKESHIKAFESHALGLKRNIQKMIKTSQIEFKNEELKTKRETIADTVASQFEAVLEKHRKRDPKWYNNDGRYRSAVDEMLLVMENALSVPLLSEIDFEEWSNKQNFLRQASRMCHRDQTGKLNALKPGEAKQQHALNLCKRLGIVVDYLEERNEMSETPLIREAADGRAFQVLMLLEAGADRDAKQENSLAFTAMNQAAYFGHADAMRHLLKFGADVNVVDGHGGTPLVAACLNGAVECVRVLLSNKADVNKATKSGTTPLHKAAIRGYNKIIRMLIVAGAKCDIKNGQGKTAMELVDEHKFDNDEECKESLRKTAQDIRMEDWEVEKEFDSGRKDTHIKSFENQALELRRELEGMIKMGSSEFCCEVKPGKNTSAQDTDKDELGQLDVVDKVVGGFNKMLAVHRSRDFRWYNDDGRYRSAVFEMLSMNDNAKAVPRLTMAMYKEWNQKQCFLRQAGRMASRDRQKEIYSENRLSKKRKSAALDYCKSLGLCMDKLEERNEMSETPLIREAADGHLRNVKLLLEAGADVEAQQQNAMGFNAINMAAYFGHYHIIKTLIDFGAEVDTIDAYGGTPLIAAALNGEFKCMELLIQEGANVNHQTINGNTPLMKSAINGHIVCVRYLLAKGARVDTKNIKQQTAKHLCKEALTQAKQRSQSIDSIDTEAGVAMEAKEEELQRVVEKKKLTKERVDRVLKDLEAVLKEICAAEDSKVTAGTGQHQLTIGRERACSNECIGDDANATHYCEQCSKSLCQLCVSMHSRQRATVGHTLVTMQELQNRS